MHTELRLGPIERIYIHTNEGPEYEGSAENLANYLHNDGADGGGYHIVVDDKETVRVAEDDEVVWGEGGDNEHALALCIVGYAAQTPNDWADSFSHAAIERAAQQVALWCKQYGIPAVHVAPGAPGEAPTGKGIAEHADDHDPNSEGHTDPGAGFPLAAFIARVNEILTPAPNVNWGAIEKIAEWVQRLTKTPLVINDRGSDVVALNQFLVANGANASVEGYAYGNRTSMYVHRFKAAHGWPVGKQSGNKCGGPCAEALVKNAK